MAKFSDIGKHPRLFIEGVPTIDGLAAEEKPLSGLPLKMLISDELTEYVTIDVVDRDADFLREMALKAHDSS